MLDDYIVANAYGDDVDFVHEIYNKISEKKFQSLIKIIQNEDILFPFWLATLGIHNRNPYFTDNNHMMIGIIKYKDTLYKSMQYIMNDKNISKNHGRLIVYDTIDKKTNKKIHQKLNNLRELIVDKCYELLPRILRIFKNVSDMYNKEFIKRIIYHYIGVLEEKHNIIIKDPEVIFLCIDDYHDIIRPLKIVPWEHNIDEIKKNLYSSDRILNKFCFDINLILNRCDEIYEQDLSRTLEEDRDYKSIWFDGLYDKAQMNLYNNIMPTIELNNIFSRIFIRCTINDKKSLILLLNDKFNQNCFLKILDNDTPLTLTDKILGNYYSCREYLANNEDYTKLYDYADSILSIYYADQLYIPEEIFLYNILHHLLNDCFECDTYNVYRLKDNRNISIIGFDIRRYIMVHKDTMALFVNIAAVEMMKIIIDKKTLKILDISLKSYIEKKKLDIDIMNDIYKVVNIFKEHLPEYIAKHKDEYFTNKVICENAIKDTPKIYCDIDNIENFIIEQDYYYHNGAYLNFLKKNNATFTTVPLD